MENKSYFMENVEHAMFSAAETYSNIHRGVGYKSQVSTYLYEKAREIFRVGFSEDANNREVVISTPIVADEVVSQAEPGAIRVISSDDLQLPLGVRILIGDRKTFEGINPPFSGGGTVKLVSRRSFIKSGIPQILEAGTPSVLNVIGCAAACAHGQTAVTGSAYDEHTGNFSIDELLGLHDFAKSTETDDDPLLRFRDSLIGRRYFVPTATGRCAYKNFDSAATTSVPLPVWNTVKMALRQRPTQRHGVIQTVRKELLAYLNASEDEYDVIFTSNTTMAINLLTRIMADPRFAVDPLRVLNTWFEHNSNEMPWRLHENVRLDKIPLGQNGTIDLRAMATRLDTGKHGLVAFCGSSNVAETGIDIRAVCDLAHERGSMTFVDASQLMAHSRINMVGDGIDFLALSGHKAYAPFGIGALVGRKDRLRRLDEIHPGYSRAMEENFVGIAALGKAVRLLETVGIDRIGAEEKRLTSMFFDGVSRVRAVVPAKALPKESISKKSEGGIITFNVSGIPHNRCAQLLAEQGGLGIRNGCFCSHLYVKRLLRMNPIRTWIAETCIRKYPRSIAILPGLVRVCISVENDDESVRELLEALRHTADSASGLLSRLFAFAGNGLPRLPETDVGRMTGVEAYQRAQKIFGGW